MTNLSKNLVLHKFSIAVAAGVVATFAFAHEGVDDPIVKERMQNMSSIQTQMKLLGDMARGRTEFDAELAREASAALAEEALQLTILFETHATDPKSKARAEIWSNFEDFSAKSHALFAAANDASNSIRNDANLKTAVRAIGGTCSSCHKAYRN